MIPENPFVTLLREFHEKYGHAHYHSPTIPPAHICDLRIRLINEETQEVVDALLREDLVDISKELCDLLYVTIGTIIAYGLPVEALFAEVHRSNMTKSYDKDQGKTQKGSSYEPPDLDIILKEFMIGNPPRTELSTPLEYTLQRLHTHIEAVMCNVDRAAVERGKFLYKRMLEDQDEEKRLRKMCARHFDYMECGTRLHNLIVKTLGEDATIGDVADKPIAEWNEVKGFGMRLRAELVEILHHLGVPTK